MSKSLHTMFRRLFDATLGREIESRIQAAFDRELDARIHRNRLHDALVFGDRARLSIAPTAIVNNALFNTVSGRIVIGEYTFFGHNVCVLTGDHDVASLGEQRQKAIPTEGHDIVIEAGAWVASNATILGPCVVGEHAVVAAGAVVVSDVPAFSIVGGVPARTMGEVPRTEVFVDAASRTAKSPPV